jgi:hypothetical protein
MLQLSWKAIVLTTLIGISPFPAWSNETADDIGHRGIAVVEPLESLDWYRLDHCVPAPVDAVPVGELEPIPDRAMSNLKSGESPRVSLPGVFSSCLLTLSELFLSGVESMALSEREPSHDSGPTPTLAPPPDEVIPLVLKEKNVLCVPVEVEPKKKANASPSAAR